MKLFTKLFQSADQAILKSQGRMTAMLDKNRFAEKLGAIDLKSCPSDDHLTNPIYAGYAGNCWSHNDSFSNDA